MADSTEALEDKMPGLSQTDCLAGKGSEGDRGPCAACQSAKYCTCQTGCQRCRPMPTKSATGDPRCSRLKPRRREVPANAPDGYPGHRVLWANWPATTVYQKGW